MDNNKTVSVEVKDFEKFFDDLKVPLALDMNYQRPYVWGEEKVSQLLDDLKYYQDQTGNKPHYYMGNVLLHMDTGRKSIFVIDGQQRITTLATIYHIRHNKLPEKFGFEFNSMISVKNIRNTLNFCKKSGVPDIDFKNIVFTVITVNEEDLAFTFFDTQNTRGVPLAATDLLKAYHLRAIDKKEKRSEIFQTYSARRWESIQNVENGNDFVQGLFTLYLWRARNWKGSQVKVRENHEDILKEFQKNTVEENEVQEIPLYANSSNQWARSIVLTPENSYRINLNPVTLEGNASNLPFAIRQPVHEGIGFFLFAEKYASILMDLKAKPIDPKSERGRFHILVQGVIEKSGLSGYLKNLFWLAVLMYVDQFGDRGLTRFAETLDYSLGALRIEKASIVKETPVKYLRDRDVNLLDIIAGAYRPEEVIDFLFIDEHAKNVYARKDISELIKIGVRERYANAVSAYYGHRLDWSNRHNWKRGNEK